MDAKEAIIQAAIDLINEKGEEMNTITVREICRKANVGLGLVNYHFGNKDRLIELCVERMVSDIVDIFRSIQEKTAQFSAFERLEYLGNMTFTFLSSILRCRELLFFQICVRRKKMTILTRHTLPIFRLCPPAARTGTKKPLSAKRFA